MTTTTPQPTAPQQVCWCGAPATYLVPVDPEVTTPTARMSDGQPALAVCDQHMDRDGYEALARPDLEVPEDGTDHAHTLPLVLTLASVLATRKGPALRSRLQQAYDLATHAGKDDTAEVLATLAWESNAMRLVDLHRVVAREAHDLLAEYLDDTEPDSPDGAGFDGRYHTP